MIALLEKKKLVKNKKNHDFHDFNIKKRISELNG